VPADVSVGSAGGTLATLLPKRNFHFWEASGRTEINPADIIGVTVTLRARFAPGQLSIAGSRECMVLSVGADYWLSKTSPWKPRGQTVRDVGIGRFKLVEPSWRLYTMTSASARVLRSHPLPYVVPLSELH
jgi:hypothetical protein